MHSLFLLFVVAIIAAGLLFFIVALLQRNRRRMALTAPAPLLIVLWLLVAGHTPNAEKQFDRLFGSQNREVVSELQTLKPLLMDGFFITFRVGPEDFSKRIRPGLEASAFDAKQFLLGQDLPQGWPDGINSLFGGYSKYMDGESLRVIYLPENESVYASLAFESW